MCERCNLLYSTFRFRIFRVRVVRYLTFEDTFSQGIVVLIIGNCLIKYFFSRGGIIYSIPDMAVRFLNSIGWVIKLFMYIRDVSHTSITGLYGIQREKVSESIVL